MLVNPVWQALNGAHKAFVAAGSTLLRYQPDVLPFAAVEAADRPLPIDTELDHGPIFFCDLLPALERRHFTTARFRVPQMLYRGAPQSVPPREDEVELTLANAAEMVELTDVAFPGFFRPHSVRLGRFVGIRHNGQLVAMAGERFRLPGLREISAVCTRPGFTGKGFATHLIQRLLAAHPDTPFLHVSESNAHAVALYQRLGFEHHRTIEVMRVSRAA